MTGPAPAIEPAGGRDVLRARRGWVLYDAANSAFVTTVVTALGGPFLTALAEDAAGGHSGRVALLGLHPRTGSIYAYTTSLSVICQVLLLPALGALADRPRGKQRLLTVATAVGVLGTVGFGVATGWITAALALVVANIAFGAALVAYNAYLADVAAPEERDKVSSQGFAVGYVGGALVLAVALAGLAAADGLGLGKGTVVRGAVLLAALWWAVIGMFSIRRLAPVADVETGRGVATALTARMRESVRELRGLLRELRALPHTARYLAAFLLYNDAIQAVIALSSVFLTQELFVANGKSEDDATGFLLALILVIQIVATGGALLFARLAGWMTTKRALLVSIAGWVVVVVFAYAWLTTIAQAWALGIVIALVLGGSQALARSLFSQMIPAGRQAAYFGVYELAERGTAWIGTLIFAVTFDVTGSYRLAILSLLVLFVSGGALLARTDTDRAIRDASAFAGEVTTGR